MAFLQHCKFVHENVHGQLNLNQIKFACVLLENEAYLVSFEDRVYYVVNNRIYEIEKLRDKGVFEFRYGYSDGSPTNYHILALTYQGKLYGWGDNRMKQVSCQSYEEFYEPERLNQGFYRIKFLCMTSIFNKGSLFYRFQKWRGISKIYVEYKSIACGSRHNLAQTSSNSLTIWGSNDMGQLGNGGEKNNRQEMPVTKIGKLKLKPNVSICCYITLGLIVLGLILLFIFLPWAVGFTFLLITSILVIRFFLKKYKTRKIKFRIKIDEDCLINTIACGSVHNLVLFDNGNVWGWGGNSRGQLGRIPNGAIKRPRPLFQNAIMISASMDQSLVLCKGGILHSMGNNILAQCGKFDLNEYPKPLVVKMNFVDIAAFNNIALARDGNGIYYAWGLFKYEELREKQEIEDKKNESKDEETDETKAETRVTSFEQGKNDNEVKETEGILRKVIRFYIIPEPKRANCSSFNNFIERYSSMTYHTIQNLSYIAPNVHGNNSHNQTEFAFNLHGQMSPQLRESLVECNLDETVIDPKDMLVIEYYPGDDEKSKDPNNTTNNFHIGDANKFSVFDNSPVNCQGNVNVSDVKQTGNNTTYDKVRNLFN